MKDRIRTISNAIARGWAYLRREQVPSIDIGDVQVVAGFGALIYGVSLVSVPAAWMLSGALLLIGWILPRLPRRAKEQR